MDPSCGVRRLSRIIVIFSILVASTTSSPLLASEDSSKHSVLYRYPGNHGFIHPLGSHAPQGWAAVYRMDSAGYLISGRRSGGEELEPGVYRYTVHASLLRSQLGGLLKNANDAIRLEAWDVTTQECLVKRTFQSVDFEHTQKLAHLPLVFSTTGREGHRFEPRIYWAGVASVFIHQIDLEKLEDVALPALKEKADRMESLMARHLDRGFVIAQLQEGRGVDTNDAATWTGFYAACQAWRYKATQNPEALLRMENALRALHRCRTASPTPGTLVRYVDPNGRPAEQTASRDTYEGFFFAMSHCLPLVRDPVLKRDLLEDVQMLATHFVANDFAFVPANGPAVELNSSFSPRMVQEGIQGLVVDPKWRHKTLQAMTWLSLYFRLQFEKTPTHITAMRKALESRDAAEIQKRLVPFLSGLREALFQIEKNVAHSMRRAGRLHDAPYPKLHRLILKVLQQLPPLPESGTHQSLREWRFLASNSRHALHILKVASDVLPKPNRFQQVYADNLWKNQALLKTALEWDQVDEEILDALQGHTRAAAGRSNSQHLPFLAMYDLIRLEKDPAIRLHYRLLFDRSYQSHQNDLNAMIDTMQSLVGLAADQRGLAWWSLGQYPEDRQGKGDAVWKAGLQQTERLYGGSVGRFQMRDPVPVNERQRDAFIWQRGSRLVRGDDRRSTYSPFDYLFVYWLGREASSR